MPQDDPLANAETFLRDRAMTYPEAKEEFPWGHRAIKVKGKIFRIGHLGSLNELELLGALAGVEMALKGFGVRIAVGAGLAAAENYLLETALDS